MEEEGRGAQASCLVAKQAVEFPQVLASTYVRTVLFPYLYASFSFL